MKKAGFFMLLIVLAVINQQCLKPVDYAQREQEEIQNFLSTNNITVAPTESGLYYVEDSVGTGQQPVKNDTVTINYITYRLSGLVIDTNIESVAKQNNIWREDRSYTPFSFKLGSDMIIQGVNEGVGYMREGGTATLVIPSKLAYNDYQPLAFYIELLQVKHDTTVVK